LQKVIFNLNNWFKKVKKKFKRSCWK